MESPPLVWLHDAATGKKLAELKNFDRPPVALSWPADDGRLLVAAQDNTLRQINVGAGVEFSRINAPHDAEIMGEVHKRSLDKAAFGPRSVDAFTSSDYPAHVHRWNLDTGKKVWTIRASEAATGPIVISPDGRIMACAWGHSGGNQPDTSGVSLWSVATQQELMQIDLAGASPYSMAFSPDGRRVVTGFDSGTALVWNVAEAVAKLE